MTARALVRKNLRRPIRPDLFCYVSERCRMFLNNRELIPMRSEPADYQTRLSFDSLPLKKGWNHLLIKVACSQLAGQRPGTLAVRLRSNQADYFRQLESAVELPAFPRP